MTCSVFCRKGPRLNKLEADDRQRSEHCSSKLPVYIRLRVPTVYYIRKLTLLHLQEL